MAATETTVVTEGPQNEQPAKLDAAATAVVSKYREPITKGMQALRVLAGKERDIKVAVGRHLRRLFDALVTLKLDDELIHAEIIALCGDAPKTGAPYEWGTIKGMIDASRIIDGLPADLRAHIGTDAALKLKQIPDDAERETFIRDRAEAGETFSPVPLRAAVDEWLIEQGYKTEPTLKGMTGKVVTRWKDSDSHSAAKLHVDRFKATPEYADMLEAVTLFTAKACYGTDKLSPKQRATVEAVSQLLFPNGRPKATPKPKAKAKPKATGTAKQAA